MGNDGCPQLLAQIEHIALATSDLKRLCDFYRLLGAMAAPSPADPDPGLRSGVLDFWGIRLEVFERPGSGGRSAGYERSAGLMHLGFALESADAVDDLTSELAASGHRVLELPHRTGEVGRYESVVLDPDGNRLKLTV